jgi:transposase
MSGSFSNFIGVDVSKEKVDAFLFNQSRYLQIPNNEEELEKSFNRFHPSSTLVVLENTGGYEKHCLKALSKLGFNIHRTNNNKVKHFIRSLGEKAKTDKIDSKMLAIYGKERQKELELYELEPEIQEKIKQLASYLSALKRARAAEKNRAKSPGYDLIKDQVKATLTIQDKRIEDLQKKIEETFNNDKDLSNKIDLISQYVGIGRTTAIRLMTNIPELGTVSKRSVTSLGGLAPFVCESGKKKNNKTTKGSGRMPIKPILYMPTLTAIRWNPEISAYYKQLIGRGKKGIVAVTACMRKILVQINAILKKSNYDKKNIASL